MSFVRSVFGTLIGRIVMFRPYWAVKLQDGRFFTEIDTIKDRRTGQKRFFDWLLDLYQTRERHLVTELWMFTPPVPSKGQMQGGSVFLEVKEPGCYFQFKVATMHALTPLSSSQLECMIIGRVDNKETGDCTCFIWDTELQDVLLWHSNIYHMGSWKPGIAPLGRMDHTVLGINLR